jgi:hypothetical protein
VNPIGFVALAAIVWCCCALAADPARKPRNDKPKGRL